MEKIKVGKCPVLGDRRVELTTLPSTHKQILEFALRNDCRLKESYRETILINWPDTFKTKLYSPTGLYYGFCDQATKLLDNKKVRVTIGSKGVVRKVIEGIVMLPLITNYERGPIRLQLLVTTTYNSSGPTDHRKPFEIGIKPTKIISIEEVEEETELS